jgi:O-antigen ligase
MRSRKSLPSLTNTSLLDWSIAAYVFLMFGLQATEYYYLSSYVVLAVLVLWIPSLASFRKITCGLELTLAVGLLVTTLASALFSEHECWPWVIYAFKVWVVSWIVMVRCSTIARFRLYLSAAFLGALILVAIPGLILGGTSVAESSQRQIGITSEPNAYGFVLTGGFWTSLILITLSPGKWKWVLIVSWPIFLWDIAASGSRQAAVNVLVMILGYITFNWILSLRGLLRGALISFVLCVIFIFVWSVLEDSALADRIGNRSISEDSRLELIEISWGLFSDHPWFGTGPGSFIRYTRWVYTHTAFMELLAMTGLFSFICYYAMIGFSVFRYMRSLFGTEISRSTMAMILAMLIATVVAGCFNLTHISKINTFLVASCIGVAHQFCKNRKRSFRLNSSSGRTKKKLRRRVVSDM